MLTFPRLGRGPYAAAAPFARSVNTRRAQVPQEFRPEDYDLSSKFSGLEPTASDLHVDEADRRREGIGGLGTRENETRCLRGTWRLVVIFHAPQCGTN